MVWRVDVTCSVVFTEDIDLPDKLPDDIYYSNNQDSVMKEDIRCKDRTLGFKTSIGKCLFVYTEGFVSCSLPSANRMHTHTHTHAHTHTLANTHLQIHTHVSVQNANPLLSRVLFFWGIFFSCWFLRPRGCTRGLFRSLRSRDSIHCRGRHGQIRWQEVADLHIPIRCMGGDRACCTVIACNK